jgi:hypothetical protein
VHDIFCLSIRGEYDRVDEWDGEHRTAHALVEGEEALLTHGLLQTVETRFVEMGLRLEANFDGIERMADECECDACECARKEIVEGRILTIHLLEWELIVCHRYTVVESVMVRGIGVVVWCDVVMRVEAMTVWVEFESRNGPANNSSQTIAKRARTTQHIMEDNGMGLTLYEKACAEVERQISQNVIQTETIKTMCSHLPVHGLRLRCLTARKCTWLIYTCLLPDLRSFLSLCVHKSLTVSTDRLWSVWTVEIGRPCVALQTTADDEHRRASPRLDNRSIDPSFAPCPASTTRVRGRAATTSAIAALLSFPLLAPCSRRR